MTVAHVDINPDQGRGAASFGFTQRIVASQGHYHIASDGTRLLDFVAQAGAVPFGHNPTFLVEAIREHLEAGAPAFCAPLRAEFPSRLASLLCAHAFGGFDRCVLTNSGAECVEVAIKLARSRTQRTRILSLENGFHGKTLGALSATHNQEYKTPFLLDTSGFASVAREDAAALEAELSTGEYAALIVEPVQGEGGMLQTSVEYLERARSLCDRFGSLLVLDEIQTGLGRTGYFTAAEALQLRADVLLLAKALGGGLVPIGACLTTAEVWNAEFALKHSSTFANNSLTSRVAIAVVEKLLEDDGAVLQHVRDMGEHLARGLARVVEKYPECFERATGAGLMQALHLRQRTGRANRLLSLYGAPMIGSYLLNRHGIVTLLTLNKKYCIRIEPSLTITEAEIDRLLAALADVGQKMESGLTAELYAYTCFAKAGDAGTLHSVHGDTRGAPNASATRRMGLSAGTSTDCD